MDTAAANPAIVSHPLVYAGRFADLVTTQDLPEGCHVLDEWDVLPSRLAAVSARATAVVVVDPFSFPFEVMTKDEQDLPLVVVLPRGFDAKFLADVFGEPIFKRLGFFDRVATDDPALWEELRARYRWVGSQRLTLEGAAPGEAAAEVCARLEAEESEPVPFEEVGQDAARYWRGRGAALATTAPRRAVFGAHRDPALGKAVHRVQAAALEPQLAAARGEGAPDAPFDVLEVGAGVGRWASTFDPATTRFAGVDISEDMVEAARANFPGARFDVLDEDLRFPHAVESFDLVFGVDVMHHNPAPAKLGLISEMWRVTRPGGRLLFLEDFVAEGHPEGSAAHPMSVLKFVDVILEATDGQVVLEYVEALRYPRDPFFRAGLLALSKLGVPKTW